MLTFANFRMPVNDAGTSEIYSFGGYSHRDGTGNALPPLLRQRPQLAGDLSAGLPADVQRPGDRLFGGRRAPGRGLGLELRCWARSSGTTTSTTTSTTRTTRRSAPASTCPAPRAPTGILGTADDPGIPNQTVVLRRPGAARGVDRRAQHRQAGGARAARAGQPRLRRRLPAGALRDPRGRAGVLRQRLPPGPGQRRPSRRRARQASRASRPDDATDRHRNNFGLYADAETNLTSKVLANVAARFENYSDFGEQVTGKVGAPLPAARGG